MDITLTPAQEKAMKLTMQRYKNGEKYTVIAGYAGTGKSELLKFIKNEFLNLGIQENKICFSSFTGKATQVLAAKDNKNCMTLHKLLYDSYPLPNGGFKQVPYLTIPYDIVFVDEISMVPKFLIELLFSHKVYVICSGDPEQLEPIYKDEDNQLLKNPHIFLSEIMRQALESDIIRLSMEIRENGKIETRKTNEVQIYNKNELTEGMLIWADQILVATNSTRIKINEQTRQLLGKEKDTIENGEKVICTKNYWDILSEGNALTNGSIGTLQSVFCRELRISNFIFPASMVKNRGGSTYIPIISANFLTEDNNIFTSLYLDEKNLKHGEPFLNQKMAYILGKKVKYLLPLEFLYGYAITCHKAQGSQWNKVLIIEEKFPFGAESHRRWLYTAVTRACEKVVLIKKE